MTKTLELTIEATKSVANLTAEALKDFNVAMNTMRDGFVLGGGWNDHMLTRNWNGYMEFHLLAGNSDLVVIYKVDATTVRVFLVGSHRDMDRTGPADVRFAVAPVATGPAVKTAAKRGGVARTFVVETRRLGR